MRKPGMDIRVCVCVCVGGGGGGGGGGRGKSLNLHEDLLVYKWEGVGWTKASVEDGYTVKMATPMTTMFLLCETHVPDTAAVGSLHPG